MLKEVTGVELKPIPGAARRRWFQDIDIDLIVWFDEADVVLGFQLCYDKGRNEHAVTWRRDRAARHDRVDSGESEPFENATPILVADGIVDYADIARRFEERADELEPSLRALVREQLLKADELETS